MIDRPREELFATPLVPPPSMYSQCPKNIRRLSYPLRKHENGAIFHTGTNSTWGRKDISGGGDVCLGYIRFVENFFREDLLLERSRTANIPLLREKSNGSRDLTIVARHSPSCHETKAPNEIASRCELNLNCFAYFIY